MKKQSVKLKITLLSVLALILLTKSYQTAQSAATLFNYRESEGDLLKKKVLAILETKCNVCHRKQNPLMVFKEKNMVKRAPKIYKQVFVDTNMPKGNEIQLTSEEYNTLKKWLLTQEIY